MLRFFINKLLGDAKLLFQFSFIVTIFHIAVPSAAAFPISLGPAIVDIDIVSDVNDWQWNIKLDWNGGAGDPDITSFHISGLEGDVTDSWEYEDWQVTDGWSNPPTTTKATGAIGWKSGANENSPLSETNLGVRLSFDSDYPWDSQRIYMISVDNENGKWFSTAIQDQTPIIPEPGTAILFLSGLVGLVAYRKRQKQYQ
ncbi:MAG: PEP-CTERM sorting domain-containing protein [Candidatus Omnitrophica bacterium]|nr:PEP-CTERM sorting domain-containing protein [Cyclobacteriaceae bacterium]MCK5492253.1 PEP-CTERM sorting domain-containing protein [Candidatus Omnitrophota bacterium]